jgi:soluble cytochrome b562
MSEVLSVKKIVLLFSFMLLSTWVAALGLDAKQTMKAMKLSYIETMKANEMEAFKLSLTEFDELVAHAKTLPFPQSKQALFVQGLNRVSALIDEARVRVEQGQLQQAQEIMEQVDALRKEYHDQRNESIWKRIFG